jgi:hypothetical protein
MAGGLNAVGYIQTLKDILAGVPGSQAIVSAGAAVPTWAYALIYIVVVAAVIASNFVSQGGAPTRPRLVLVAEDDKRCHDPIESRFFLENTGTADAFNIELTPVVMPGWKIRPRVVRRLAAGGDREEVKCDAEIAARPLAPRTNEPLAKVLCSAYRNVGDSLSRGWLSNGEIDQSFRLSYRDQDGHTYKDRFLSRFWWGTHKFQPIEHTPGWACSVRAAWPRELRVASLKARRRRTYWWLRNRCVAGLEAIRRRFGRNGLPPSETEAKKEGDRDDPAPPNPTSRS